MAEFRRAKIDKSSGDILLTAGDYFIDLDAEDFREALPELSRVIPQTYFRETLHSGGRGNMLVSIRSPGQIRIPNSIAQQVGFFFELPEGRSLQSVSNTLYGAGSTEPRGFWEWLATEHPDVFNAAKKTAQAIDETRKAIPAPEKVGVAALKYAAIGLAIFLVFKLVTTPRAAPPADEY